MAISNEQLLSLIRTLRRDLDAILGRMPKDTTYDTKQGHTHPGGAGVSDHGALTGLGDDDHTQYRLESENHNHTASGAQGGTLDHGTALTGLGDDDHTQYRLESENHNHQSSGAQAGTLDHGLALTGLTDDDHTQYLKEEASGGLASEVPDHTHAGGSTAGALFSSVNYVFTTDAAPGTAVAAGEPQGAIHITGDNDETGYEVVVAFRDGPTTGSITLIIEIGSTNDKDSAGAGTTLKSVTLTASGSKVLGQIDSFTGTITADRLLWLNVSSVTVTAGPNWDVGSVILRAKRPVVA